MLHKRQLNNKTGCRLYIFLKQQQRGEIHLAVAMYKTAQDPILTPLCSMGQTSEKTSKDYSKVNRTIIKFVNLGILKVTDNSKKKRTYVYEEYVGILKE